MDLRLRMNLNLKGQAMTDEKEFIWVTHQKGSIKYYSEAAYEKLQSEVERLQESLDVTTRAYAGSGRRIGDLQRQISLRKASESVDEELRTKLEAAEAVAAAANDLVKNYEEAVKELRNDARRLAEALGMVVAQFEDMQDSNDIQEHWHKIAREALTPEIRERYLK